MNKLSMEKKVAAISALIEGCSVRSTSRMTGVAKGTILRLLADVGTACLDYHDRVVRNVTSKRVQVDEIWSFCYAKEKNVPAEKRGQPGYGDVWTWVGIDADTKLAISWFVGDRYAGLGPCVHVRSVGPAQEPRAAYLGRPQGVPASRRGCVRSRHRLRDARKALRQER